MNSFADTIEQIIGPALEEMGFSIVRVLMGGSKRKRLQVMIERKDGTNITLDDCADASRAISVLLDVEDPIEGNYMLEVSSPGLDRPLVKLNDFVRFQGHEIQLELHNLLEGRKRFQGHLTQVDGDIITLTYEGKVATIPFSDILKAKLVPDFTFQKTGR